MAPSATSIPQAGVSKAGITTDDAGQRHIPSSVRPDGTVRKEIRVRPGYRPPEDVEVYKNRTAEAWKNRGKAPVPGSEQIAKDEPSSAAANKNAKRREARKKAATVTSETPVPEPVKEEPVDPEVEKAKEARKLTKKLRQARELKDKKEQGDALLPEQFEKVIKINELIRQLDKLGFNPDGEKKTESDT